MNKEIAKAIEALRKANPVKCCWLDGTPEERAKQMSDMQKQYPLNEIVGVGWNN